MHRRSLGLLCALLLVVGTTAVTGSAARPVKAPTQKEIAERVLDSPAGRLMTAPARAALEMMARGTRELGHDADQSSSLAGNARAKQAEGGDGPGNGEFVNVRVNNPGEDTHQVDQTTQSETAIAAAGRHVVVGFNDTQTALFSITSGGNISGYGYSSDGGRSFTDGGVIPNIPGNINFGDPWLASDPGGNFYYSTLTLNLTPQRGIALDVAVAKSSDGGKTFAVPVRVDTQPEADQLFYFGDKDALASGRRAAGGSGSALYDGWDDVSFSASASLGRGPGPGPGPGGPVSGLPVSRSVDGGASWHVSYASKVPMFTFDPTTNPPTCTFQQYIGAQPIVNPTDGRVYDAAEKLSQSGDCFGPPPPLTREEWIFVTTPNETQPWEGTAWQGTKIASVNQSTPDGFAFNFGPGQFMRNLEFPTLAFLGADLYAAWNEGDGAAHSHIRLAKSPAGDGLTWTVSQPVTTGNNDEMQPAMSGGPSGLHILYYQRNGDDSLDVKVSNSIDGLSFASRRVTSQSFPGVLTALPFDPLIAFFYMGDYIANASDGQDQYFAWGDNRDLVTNFLWPQGRHDPDVFFARQGRAN